MYQSKNQYLYFLIFISGNLKFTTFLNEMYIFTLIHFCYRLCYSPPEVAEVHELKTLLKVRVQLNLGLQV